MTREQTGAPTRSRLRQYRLVEMLDDAISRALLQAVHLRRPKDVAPVALVLSLVGAIGWLYRELEDALADLNLTMNEFGVSVVLLMLDPTPVSSMDLAFHLKVSRGTLWPTLRKLESTGCMVRRRDRSHRGTARFRLTSRGRKRAEETLNRYLVSLVAIGNRLPRTEWPVLARVCAALRDAPTSPDERPTPFQSFDS